jgi:hypothetical protein
MVNNKLSFFFGGAGDQIQDLEHARQVLYHWIISSVLIVYFNIANRDFEFSQHREMINVWGEGCANDLIWSLHILYVYWNVKLYPINVTTHQWEIKT